jgi:hypothetical protein
LALLLLLQIRLVATGFVLVMKMHPTEDLPIPEPPQLQRFAGYRTASPQAVKMLRYFGRSWKKRLGRGLSENPHLQCHRQIRHYP